MVDYLLFYLQKEVVIDYHLPARRFSQDFQEILGCCRCWSIIPSIIQTSVPWTVIKRRALTGVPISQCQLGNQL